MSEHSMPPSSDAASDAIWTQKRRLAAAIRRVIEQSMTARAPEADWQRAAERLEQYAEYLAALPREHVTWGNPEAALAGEVHGFFDLSPIIGRVNPLAPPMTLWAEGSAVRGTVSFGWAYQGPPGHAHGGLIAAAFDEILGFAQTMTGKPGMTGTLTIRYRQPTPLYTEIRVEGAVDRIEGRKIFASGKMFNGESLTAEAEGIFISMNESSVRKLIAGNARLEQRS